MGAQLFNIWQQRFRRCFFCCNTLILGIFGRLFCGQLVSRLLLGASFCLSLKLFALFLALDGSLFFVDLPLFGRQPVSLGLLFFSFRALGCLNFLTLSIQRYPLSLQTLILFLALAVLLFQLKATG